MTHIGLIVDLGNLEGGISSQRPRARRDAASELPQPGQRLGSGAHEHRLHCEVVEIIICFWNS